MQATVYRYDPATGSGSVLTDDGAVLPFTAEALRLSGLRHLRPGQRLTVERAPAPAAAADAANVGDSDGDGDGDGDGTESHGEITQLTLGTIGNTLRQ